MSAGPTGRCCVRCASEGPLEDHHPAGEANIASATVPVCRPLHIEWHECMRSLGVQLSHEGKPSPEQLAWAFFCGFSILLEESTHAGGCDDQLLSTIERSRRGLARLLTSLGGGAARVGPDPIANASRGAQRTRRHSKGRRGKRSACQAPAPGDAERSHERVHAFAAGALPAITLAIEELLCGSRHGAYVERVKRFALGSRQLAVAVIALERYSRRAELSQLLEWDTKTLGAAFDALRGAELRAFAEVERRYLDLFLELVEAPNQEAIFALVDEFINATGEE